MIATKLLFIAGMIITPAFLMLALYIGCKPVESFVSKHPGITGITALIIYLGWMLFTEPIYYEFMDIMSWLGY